MDPEEIRLKYKERAAKKAAEPKPVARRRRSGWCRGCGQPTHQMNSIGLCPSCANKEPNLQRKLRIEGHLENPFR